MRDACYHFVRTGFHVMFMAVVGLTAVHVPLSAQLCTGTSPPCVLTAGYAGPATDASFNSRQSINPYETTFSPTSVGSLTTTGTLFEVDDSASPILPQGATSNPIMAQPLYVTGISVSSPANTANCNNNTTCNMLLAATLNSTVFAWVADGTNAGKLLWSRQGTPTSGQGNAGNALYYDDCNQTGSSPVQTGQVIQFDGILSTPVIDARAATTVVYLTSFCQTSTGTKKWFLHEINLQTGQDVVSARDIGQQDVGSSFTAKWQQQRPALLLAKNSGNTSTPNLLYILFGTNVPEWTYSKDYTGWLVAYTTGSGGSLTLKFAYSNEPTSCGTGGGLTDAGASNGQCNVNPNSGSPSCDCYTFPTGPNAPNWGGHGGGCWSSGNGPAATTAGAINSDGAVHVFFGCGNGGFQEFNGSSQSASNNNGSTIMDFRLTSSGFDSNSTGAFQTFTPNSPATGVGPTAATKCGCDSNGQNCSTCSYTTKL